MVITIFFAYLFSSLQSECTPLHYAAENGHTEVVSLLLEKGADIEAKDPVE